MFFGGDRLVIKRELVGVSSLLFLALKSNFVRSMLFPRVREISGLERNFIPFGLETDGIYNASGDRFKFVKSFFKSLTKFVSFSLSHLYLH